MIKEEDARVIREALCLCWIGSSVKISHSANIDVQYELFSLDLEDVQKSNVMHGKILAE